MGTRQWPGFEKRLIESIRAAGFPNVAQFADAKGYRITYAYKWARGMTPDPENLRRLAADLGVTVGWLLNGDEVNKAPIPPHKRGGRKLGCLVAALGLWWGTAGMVPAEPGTLQVVATSADSDAVTSYRKWRRRGIWQSAYQFLSLIAVDVSPTWPLNALGIARS